MLKTLEPLSSFCSVTLQVGSIVCAEVNVDWRVHARAPPSYLLSGLRFSKTPDKFSTRISRTTMQARFFFCSCCFCFVLELAKDVIRSPCFLTLWKFVVLGVGGRTQQRVRLACSSPEWGGLFKSEEKKGKRGISRSGPGRDSVRRQRMCGADNEAMKWGWRWTCPGQDGHGRTFLTVLAVASVDCLNVQVY